MPDKLFTAKLRILPTGVAREWYFYQRKETGAMQWAGLGTSIEGRFGTDQPRNNMEETFLEDRFDPTVHKGGLL